MSQASRSDTSYMPMLEAVAARYSPQRILEWGPGRSTARLAELLPAADIVTIEHDPKWARHWRPRLPARVQLWQRPLDESYYQLKGGKKFDLAFVDGRLRRRCIEAAARLVKPTGIVVVHDAQRDWYHPAIDAPEVWLQQAWDSFDTVALSREADVDILARHVEARPSPRVPHVCMVTHGSRQQALRRTVPAVLETAGAFTLTIAANKPGSASRDFLAEVRDQLFGLVVNASNVGKPRAINAAWRLRDADYTVLLDDDALPLDPGWLDELLAIAKAFPNVGIAGHSLEPRDWPRRSAGGVAVQVQPGNLGGACILIPRRTLQQCGRYDEELPQYGESDGLYGWKVRQAGLTCLYHDHTQGTGRRFEHVDSRAGEKYRAWKNEQRAAAQVIAKRLIADYESGARPLNFSQ